jgi:DNA-binding beta-propeller fold protein YncE
MMAAPSQTPPTAAAAPGSMAASPSNVGAMGVMGTMGTSATKPASDPVQLPVDMGTPTLFWLEIGAGTVTKAAADGSGAKVVASGSPLSAPDGVTVDPEGHHFFVLNMGSVIGGGNSGSLVRYDLDGSNPQVIMKPGTKVGDVTFNTGKQVTIDRVNHKLYLGDREGSKVWRCDYDGSNLEVLVSGHDVNQIVGVGADPVARQFYFSDRNGKKLFRAGMDMPAGKTHANRDDVELIYAEKVADAMPLDIELDIKNRMIYWTDRRQYKILGMSMDMPAGETAMNRSDVKTIASNLTEAIGLALDHESGVLYVTHSGSVSMVKTDGSGLKQIGSSGSTGIAFAKLP